MFHLGWFVASGFAPQSWNEIWSGCGGTDWLMPELYVDLACALERACMDCVMFEDSSMVPDAYGGTSEHYLKSAQIAPKHDPFALLGLMGAKTRHVGLAATASTTFYPPFLFARLIATLDHITGGRAGCNLVTSSSERAMQNFGLSELIEHDVRYEMAQEWMNTVDRLWRSWAPLSSFASPQERPVIFQAGGSTAGRAFAARNADIVMADAMTADEMRAYREDIRARRTRAGENPDGCKVLFLIRLFVGETRQEGLAQQRRFRDKERTDVSRRLAGLSTGSGTDFSKFDLDQSLPPVSTQGHQSVLASFAARARGKTLREIASEPNKLEAAGDPDSIADQMDELMQAVGGDGFLIMNSCTRKMIAEVTDGVVPALQKRGLVRSQYSSGCFRSNVFEF